MRNFFFHIKKSTGIAWERVKLHINLGLVMVGRGQGLRSLGAHSHPPLPSGKLR